MEKANIINRLNRTLDDSQRQFQELLKTGTVTEIANLHTQLQDTISVKSKVDLNCTSLKEKINKLKEQLQDRLENQTERVDCSDELREQLEELQNKNKCLPALSKLQTKTQDTLAWQYKNY